MRLAVEFESLSDYESSCFALNDRGEKSGNLCYDETNSQGAVLSCDGESARGENTGRRKLSARGENLLPANTCETTENLVEATAVGKDFPIKKDTEIECTEDITIGDLSKILYGRRGELYAIDTNGDQIKFFKDSFLSLTELHSGMTVCRNKKEDRECRESRDFYETRYIRNTYSPPVIKKKEISIPKLPEKIQEEKMQLITLLAPLIFAVIFYFIYSNPMSVIFFLLSPALMLCNYLSNKMKNKKLRVESLEDWFSLLEHSTTDIERFRADERRARNEQWRSCEELYKATLKKEPSLWSRKSIERHNFLGFRLGLSHMKSKVSINFQTGQNSYLKVYKAVEDIISRYEYLSEVPVYETLPRAKNVGAVVKANDFSQINAILFQLISLHSPKDLSIVVFTDKDSYPFFEWAKWVPHVRNKFGKIKNWPLACTEEASIKLTAELENICEKNSRSKDFDANIGRYVATEYEDEKTDETCAAHCIVALVYNPVDSVLSRLVSLSETAYRSNIYFIWADNRANRIPNSCMTLIEDSTTVFSLGGGIVKLTNAEKFTSDKLSHASKIISPLYDLSGREQNSYDIPNYVTYREVLFSDVNKGMKGASNNKPYLDDFDIKEFILKNYGLRSGEDEIPAARRKNLSATVGISSENSVLKIDLQNDGPHALVAGTTGSGKSEFLQTWISAIALSKRPDEVSFLLIDYKGGSAFSKCSELPHATGLITDLSKGLANRVLISLGAEIRRRERILLDAECKDLKEYNSVSEIRRCERISSLVIVVDEFATLIKELPDFIDGILDIAQRGRSLGIHLILATQQPQGTIKDGISANINIKVVLRMTSADSSYALLNSKIASEISPNALGRAVVRYGDGKPILFQTGYIGALHRKLSVYEKVKIYDIEFEKKEVSLLDNVKRVEQKDKSRLKPDSEIFIEEIKRICEENELPIPKKPWLEPLKKNLRFEDNIACVRREKILLGISDDPNNQTRIPVYFDTENESNLLVVGDFSSGKTTFIKNFIKSAIVSYSGKVEFRVIGNESDFAYEKECIPQVGNVISYDNREMLFRVSRFLKGEIAKRKAGRSATVPTFVVIDEINVLKNEYEKRGDYESFTDFMNLLSVAKEANIYVIATTGTFYRLTGAVNSIFSDKKIVLHVSSDLERNALCPGRNFGNEIIPGRGFFDGLESQLFYFKDFAFGNAGEAFAVSRGKTANGKTIVASAGELAEYQKGTFFDFAQKICGELDFLDDFEMHEAYEIKAFPDILKSRDLQNKGAIGIEYLSLSEVVPDKNESMLIIGRKKSGRTNCLKAVLYAEIFAKVGGKIGEAAGIESHETDCGELARDNRTEHHFYVFSCDNAKRSEAEKLKETIKRKCALHKNRIKIRFAYESEKIKNISFELIEKIKEDRNDRIYSAYIMNSESAEGTEIERSVSELIKTTRLHHRNSRCVAEADIDSIARMFEFYGETKNFFSIIGTGLTQNDVLGRYRINDVKRFKHMADPSIPGRALFIENGNPKQAQTVLVE